MTHSDALTAPFPSSRWVRLALAHLTAAGGGAIAGLIQPVGPVTAAGGIALMAAALAVGLLAGALARTRWVLPLAPVAWILAFEVARAGAGLATTGPLDLGTAFGPVAFALGRVAAWGLAGLALLVGAAWGSKRDAGARRPVVLALATGLVALLALSLLLPPSSPTLRGPDGVPVDGSVSELVQVELGGHEQWIQVRGASPDLPVLLYLSGGPGQSDLPYSRVLLEPLTRDFLVVGWDQRGTGKSYPSLDAATLTLEQAVADTVELSRWLADRYGEERIYVLGESWGTMLGVLAVRSAPELFHAYLASGQMVDPLETDEGIYRDLVTTALGNGDGTLVADLAAMGPPPYRGVFDYAMIMAHYPLLEQGYTPPEAYRRRGEASGVGPWGVLGQEYGPLEKLSVVRGVMDMFAVMYPQLQDLDLRRDAPRLEVPVYLLVGEHELAARVEPAKEWFDLLEAPEKRWYSLPDAGHSVAFEQADELHRILLEDVRPA